MYTPYFAKFPQIQYDILKGKYSNFETVTNIFFRLGIIRDILSNTTSYYVLELEDGETPEILAEKVYGDSGAGWMILYANLIIDPQYEWPLEHRAFDKYIVEKYRNSATEAKIESVTINSGGTGYSNGYIRFVDNTSGVKQATSAANASISVDSNGTIQYANVISKGNYYRLSSNISAQVNTLGGTGANLTVKLSITDDDVVAYTKTRNHHYNKVITRTDATSGVAHETRFVIDKFRYTLNQINAPYDYYEPYSITLGVTTDSDEYTADNDELTADIALAEDYITGGGGASEAGADANAASYLYAGAIARTQQREVINIYGKTIIQTSRGEPVTFYDYEQELNDSRRTVKVIKKEYYSQIMREFDTLTNFTYANQRRLV
jgi:hypothetical protein